MKPLFTMEKELRLCKIRLDAEYFIHQKMLTETWKRLMCLTDCNMNMPLTKECTN